MGSVTLYPDDLQGCYDNLIYDYAHTINGNSNPMAIEVEVSINGSVFRKLYLNTYDSVVDSGGNYTYTFVIDIAKVVQSYFDNNQFFYNTAKTYPYTSADLMASVVLDFYDWEPDSDGILSLNPTTFRSSARKFFNSLANDMSDYTAATGRKFLTTKTDYRLSRQVTNLLAAYGDANVDTLRVNADSINTDISLTSGQITIIDLSDYYSSSSTFIRVYLGTLDGVDFTATGEVLTYTFLPNECDVIGLHFQNRLGVSEVFQFRTYEYEISQSRDTDLYVAGDKLRMYQGEIEKKIMIERDGFFDAEWVFFRDVVTSSVFYIEEVTGSLIESVGTFTNTPYRTAGGQIDIRLGFTYSDKQKIFIN